MPTNITYQKIIVALTFGFVFGGVTYLVHTSLTTTLDFGWSIRIAQDVFAGRDPYAIHATEATVPYPLPVFLIGIPLLPFSFHTAGALFSGASVFLVVLGFFKDGEMWRLPTLFSFPFIVATIVVPQWSPLILGAWFFPILAPYLVLVKPQSALPVGLAKWHWRGILISMGILILTLIIYPTWPWRWLQQTRSYQYIIPALVLPFGPLLVLSIRYWQKPIGRLFFIMSVLPLRAAYDLALLWLVAENKWQAWGLAISSWFIPLFFTSAAFGVKPEWSIPMLFIPAFAVLVWNQEEFFASELRMPN